MILIIGAGIAGLSLGWELAKRGQQVRVVEAGNIAAGASGVATSYLEPRLGETAMRRLEWASFHKWPIWADELEAISGAQVNFNQRGQIKVALAENLDKFEKDVALRREQQRDLKLLSPDQILELEPALSRDLASGMFLPETSWVDGLKVCQALAKAIKQLGGEIETQWPVDRVETSTDAVTLYSKKGEVIEGDLVVLANGIGANDLSGLPTDIPRSRAIRGVNLIVDQSSLRVPITHLVKHHRGNLCPRGDNRLIVGTTYDVDETNLEADAAIIEKLYRNAECILPALRDLPLHDVTCGIRVKIGDGKLLLGRSTIETRVTFSLSHAGAGFLRAPVVAAEFADYLISGERGDLAGSFIV